VHLSFAALWDAWTWEPIANCPGRFKLAGADARLPVAALAGGGVTVQVHRVPAARDEVHIARFTDGGIISYLRPDGTYVHTLNTAAGFSRKLSQLGILR
jgi:hypothetical protein